ncbi:MAG: hypothetical protein IPM98_03025 [Lewinellaceae bacterium]|nr:hypothetical protein [Lewinellaceae bacterium]
MEELGPEYFGGSHLLELHERVRLRLAQFDRLRRLNALVGATAAGWMLLGVVLVLVGWVTPARVVLPSWAFPAGFLAGVWLLKWKFESRGEWSSPCAPSKKNCAAGHYQRPGARL